MLNKIELLEDEELAEAMEQLRGHGRDVAAAAVLAISAAMAQGLEPLKAAVWAQLGLDAHTGPAAGADAPALPEIRTESLTHRVNRIQSS